MNSTASRNKCNDWWVCVPPSSEGRNWSSSILVLFNAIHGGYVPCARRGSFSYRGIFHRLISPFKATIFLHRRSHHLSQAGIKSRTSSISVFHVANSVQPPLARPHLMPTSLHLTLSDHRLAPSVHQSSSHRFADPNPWQSL
jgi:hypothetical protein